MLKEPDLDLISLWELIYSDLIFSAVRKGQNFMNLGSITRACPRRICGENEAAGLRLRAAVGGATW
jgi:hypothetical protein